MKVNVSHFRYLSDDDFAVLNAMEQLTKKQQVVPIATIQSVMASHISSGQVMKIVHELCNIKLIHHADHAKCKGYTMGYGAYDYLAMHELSNQGILLGVGNQLGVGKESDIFSIMTSTHGEAVMKLHRLGRNRFYVIYRDYLSLS